MKYPKVSINLPIYNGARSLRRRLDSFIEQTFDDFQVIITDNASTDETQDICLEYAAKDPRFIYHRNHRNMGFDFSYRRGVMNCLGSDYMVYASHGDYWKPEFLELCVRALEQEPEAVLAYSHCVFFNQAGEEHLYKDDFTIAGDSPTRYLTILARLGMCTAYYGLIRTSALAEVEWVMKMAFAATDNGVLASLALLGSFIQIDQPLFYRETPDYGSETIEQRYDRINKMAGGDLTPDTNMLATPFLLHVWSHCTIVETMVKDMEIRNRLFSQTIVLLRERYGEQLRSEMARSMRLLVAGRFHAPLIEDEKTEVVEKGRYPALDNAQLIRADAIFSMADALMPNLPELNFSRALVNVLMGRADLALPFIKKELEANPTHRGALELQAQLGPRA